MAIKVALFCRLVSLSTLIYIFDMAVVIYDSADYGTVLQRPWGGTYIQREQNFRALQTSAHGLIPEGWDITIGFDGNSTRALVSDLEHLRSSVNDAREPCRSDVADLQLGAPLIGERESAHLVAADSDVTS